MKIIKPASINIMAVSLVTPDTVKKLSRQGGAFTAVEKSPDGLAIEIIDVIQEAVFAPSEHEKILKTLSSNYLKFVTLTITEKGYYYLTNSGKLNLDHPDIIHDLKNIDRPISAIGYIVSGLKLRKEKGLFPFTCLSCDNLPNNGSILKDTIVQFSGELDKELSNWISDFGKFPSSMIDRIVPKVLQSDIDAISGIFDYSDQSPVFHEPYSLWVIEDDFVDRQSFPLEEVGIKLVPNVEKFEIMKLRCLNGTHSALAYLGYLSGYKTIFDAVSEPVFQKYLFRTWKMEIIPSIDPPSGFDLIKYTDELFKRYSNSAIVHSTHQIAMDGSQKLPQRILGTVQENLQDNRSVALLCEAIAAWIRFTGGADESGREIDVLDPLASEFVECHRKSKDVMDLVDRYLSLNQVFSDFLKRNAVFKSHLENAILRQRERGTLESLKKVLELE